MTDEQWEITIERVERQFGIADRGKERVADDEVEGWVEWVEFQGPQGRMKLERTVRPRVKGETTTFSKRIGSGVLVKKVYDQEEKVSFMKAHRWREDTDTWEEVRGAW